MSKLKLVSLTLFLVATISYEFFGLRHRFRYIGQCLPPPSWSPAPDAHRVQNGLHSPVVGDKVTLDARVAVEMCHDHVLINDSRRREVQLAHVTLQRPRL